MQDLIDEMMFGEHRAQWQKAPFVMPGSKYQDLDNIIPLLPVTKSSRFVDHFGGTGVVSWNVPTCKEKVFNDRRSSVTEFYKCLRDHNDEFLAYIDSFHKNCRQEWLECRATWNKEDDPVKRAGKWFYWICMSNLDCGNSFRRQFHPRIDNKKGTIRALKARLSNFLIENLDVFTCIKDYDSIRTVHYMDPPYIDVGTSYRGVKWGERELNRLLERIGELKGFVALSHYPSDLIDSQPYWTKAYQWNVRETLSNFNKSQEKKECLWVKEYQE